MERTTPPDNGTLYVVCGDRETLEMALQLASYGHVIYVTEAGSDALEIQRAHNDDDPRGINLASLWRWVESRGDGRHIVVQTVGDMIRVHFITDQEHDTAAHAIGSRIERLTLALSIGGGGANYRSIAFSKVGHFWLHSLPPGEIGVRPPQSTWQPLPYGCTASTAAQLVIPGLMQGPTQYEGMVPDGTDRPGWRVTYGDNGMVSITPWTVFWSK